MKNIFKPFTINSRIVPNRIVAQAMEMNSADTGGSVSDRVLQRYKKLARGKWGIVFVEAISISESHLARKNGLVINSKNLDGFKRLIDEFKKINDNSLIFFQLFHPGRNCYELSKKVKSYEDDYNEAMLLSESELDKIKDDLISAALFAQQAGADGVDLKACHGYLFGEIMRPLNTRNDKYGGSLENRSRLIIDAISSVKAKIPDLIVGSRISLYEGIPGGCGTSAPDEVIEDLSDTMAILKEIVNSGADYINVSAGIPVITPHITRPVKQNTFDIFHHFRYTKIVKRAFPDIAVIGSAYSGSKEDAVKWADTNIEKGYTDFAGFGRMSLSDTDYPAKIMESKEADINYCTMCSGCSRVMKRQEQVYCTTYDKDFRPIVRTKNG